MPITDLTLTFDRGVRCGGCGEILPDQEGVARDCLCIRLAAIECVCPDLNLDRGDFLDNCPKHGDEAPVNEAAAEQRGPWYGGQRRGVTRPYAAVPADLPADQQDAWAAVARGVFADRSAGEVEHMAPDHNLFRCSHPVCQRDAEAAERGATGTAPYPDLGPNYRECPHCPTGAAMSQAALDEHIRRTHPENRTGEA